jgi:hypothetical protein
VRDEALQKIREAKLRRLEILEEQIAARGEYDADPKLTIERDDLKKALGLVDAVSNGGIDEETRKVLRRYDQVDLNISVLSNLVMRVTALEEWIGFDRTTRGKRQKVLDLWLGALTVLLLALVIARFL